MEWPIKMGGLGICWTAFLTSPMKSAIKRAALTLLNLHDNWEWATRDEHKMLVRTMIQEAGCGVVTKRIVWVKVNPDYEIIYRPMEGLRPDAGRSRA